VGKIITPPDFRAREAFSISGLMIFKEAKLFLW